MNGPARNDPARHSSSMAATAARMSGPVPPYSSGTVSPQRPRSASSRNRSRGKVWVRSHSRRFSRGAFSAMKRWRVRRSSVTWEGSSLISILPRGEKGKVRLPSLLPRQVRLPPFAEGVDRLLAVGGHVAEGLVGHGRVAGAGHDLLEGDVGRHLGPAHRPARVAEDLLGDLGDLRVELVGGHGMVDQPHAGRLRGGQQVAGHQQFLGPGEADQLRPDDRAAVAGHQPDLHVRVADLGGLVGDGAERARVANLLVEPVEVAAGAEGLVVAGEYDEVAIVVMLQVDEQLGQLVVHARVDRVHGVAAEGAGQDPAVATEGEALVVLELHQAGSSLTRTSRRPKFSPRNRPQKASAALSRPSNSSMANFSEPSAIQSAIWLWAAPNWRMSSNTTSPSIRTRWVMKTSVCLRPTRSSMATL